MVGENEDKCLESLDPYKLPEDKWVDDVSKWPPVEYPDLYTYLIEAPGEFTREKLKSFKSLMGSGPVKVVKQNCSLCVHLACIFTTLNVEQDQHFACIANLYTNGIQIRLILD